MITDDTPLGEAKAELRTLVDKGATCPCCGQRAQVYKRQVNAAMAAALIAMWKAGHGKMVQLKAVAHPGGGDTCKMAYWGLIEEETERRPDGGRAGWWAVTPNGEAWIYGESAIPRYAHVYDGRCLWLDGEAWTIRQALGKKFDYRELMDGT